MEDVQNAKYSGIAFPPRKGSGYGFFKIATDEELIKNNIYTILHTRKGSMPGLYDFGSGVHDLLFEPINELTQGLIADEIIKAISTWEPRVTVAQIKAASIDNTRVFELVLRMKSTGQLFENTVTFDRNG